ncbi:MAG TPA: HIT domain-containing protein [Thermoanaerobaculia bacterium]|nr:HIT domain-containing protein [Thermoanaerobaculia bacterium]
MSCVFCRDVTRVGEIVFEDERVWVVLHDDWSVRGHAMVVAKTHIENASSLPVDEWLHIARMWHDAERAILGLTGAERAIILKLGILTPHLHVHIYPVSSSMTRDEVFAIIDGKTRVERDEDFVARLRLTLHAD